MCVCLRVGGWVGGCTWQLVPEVCPNYDGVVFQYFTVTPPHLGSITIVTLLYPSLSTCFYHMSESFFCHPLPIVPPSVGFHRQSPLSFSPANQFLSWREAPTTWTLTVPIILQSPPLVSAPHTECLLMLSFLWLCSPLFTALGLRPGPCQTQGVMSVAGPSDPICTHLDLPKISSKSWQHQVLDLL